MENELGLLDYERELSEHADAIRADGIPEEPEESEREE